jgi:hypothetical protein
MSKTATRRVDFFYGLEPGWLSSDRLYKVYVSQNMLAGAYVAGQFYDGAAAARQLQQAIVLFWPLVRRGLKRRSEREAHYDSSDPFSAEFLHCDSRNFQVSRSDCIGIRLLRKRSFWVPVNAGTIEINWSAAPYVV